MNSVTLSEAQQNLVKLVHDLELQGEIIITDDTRPVARLTAVSSTGGNVSLRDLKAGICWKSAAAIFTQRGRHSE